MDPTRSKSANDSERKFIGQILWLSLVGGMASFTRVSDMRIALKDAFWGLVIEKRALSYDNIDTFYPFRHGC